MRFVFGVIAVLMFLFVLVQYNDPDGPLWMVYYGVPAIWAGLAAFRPRIFTGRAARALLVASLVAAVALTIFYWPPVNHWWQQDVWWNSEESREGMGMMIVTVTLALTAAAVFYASRRFDAQPR
jgi:Transmembrane family 220, helix